MLGKTIDGKYQIVRLLGQGGMGAVYEAAHLGTGRRVALKVIIADALISRDAILRFQREARAAGVIESQHIVQVLDTGIDRELGVPFMVMEFLVGQDLQQLCRRVGPLSIELALRIVAQACSGLQKAHEAGVVHRDVKPANIYLARRDDDEVVVRLLDFGIAKVKANALASGADQALTRTGSMMGSPLYMSPEQAMGLKTVDHRTDVWSIGAVLYELLAGKTPHHDAETLGQLIMAICSTVPAPLRSLAPRVPVEVAAIVERALRIDPNERFQSAAELRDAMRRLLPGGTSLTEAMLISDAAAHSAPPPTQVTTAGAVAGATPGPLSRPASGARAGRAPWLAALAAAAALGAGGVWLASRPPLEPATEAADAPSSDVSASVATPQVAAAMSASEAPSALVPAPSVSALPSPRPVSAGAPVPGKLAPKSTGPLVQGAPLAAAPSVAPPAAGPVPVGVKPAAPKPAGLTVDREFE